MDIFKGIEKLINEHGSAAILKERILLASDQYAALEKSLAACQAKAEQAASKAEHFELENLDLHEQVRGLEEQLSERHGARLPDIQEQLLVLNASALQYARTTAASLGLNEHVVLHHFEQLRALNMVEPWGGSEYDYEWHLLPEGRGYLVRYGLLT